ncbi:CYTH domain-containing protein, partial [Candidatus Woesearchaeota archaeon]|nr:CYTH domain-containing protein [Candidatus Woesearchaeota archaeon]
MEEKEVKFLNINPDEIQEKLKSIGAERVGEMMFRSIAFDHDDFRLDKQAAWLRLRSDGSKTTLAFKK